MIFQNQTDAIYLMLNDYRENNNANKNNKDDKGELIW